MAAPRTVADYLLQRLREWEVDKVFGSLGPDPAGVSAAGERSGDRARPGFVRGGHEESCAFEAIGYAKVSGRLGICAAPAGPGALRLLPGLQEAKADQVPILAVAGGPDRSAAEDDDPYRQTTDLPSLLRGVVGESVYVLTAPEQLPIMLDRAISGALTERAPSVLVIPAGLQSVLIPARAYATVARPPVAGFEWSSVVPADFAILRAAAFLNAGRRVAVLVGTGARGAHAEIEYAADLLGAGVATSLPGKDVVSDDLPYVTGPLGPLGTRPGHDLMSGCDTLLTIGCALPPAGFLPKDGRVPAVRIDTDARRIGAGNRNEVDLLGDAAATLRALIPYLRSKKDRTWREDVEAKVRQWRRTVDAEAAVANSAAGKGFGLRSNPVLGPRPSPQQAFAELSSRLPDNAVVTTESGPLAAWYARHLRFRGGMRGVLSGSTVATGSAVSYGIGAKFAAPGRPVIVFTGGEAMQTNGLADLVTIKRHWNQWADPRLIVAVLHGVDSGAIGQSPPDVDYAPFVAGLGLQTIAVDFSDYLGLAWDQALAADRPTVLDIRVDPASARTPSDETRDGASASHPQDPPDIASLHALLPRQYRPFDR